MLQTFSAGFRSEQITRLVPEIGRLIYPMNPIPSSPLSGERPLRNTRLHLACLRDDARVTPGRELKPRYVRPIASPNTEPLLLLTCRVLEEEKGHTTRTPIDLDAFKGKARRAKTHSGVLPMRYADMMRESPLSSRNERGLGIRIPPDM